MSDTVFGSSLPRMTRPIDGNAWVDRLSLVESPAFTARRKRREEASGAKQDPIVWTQALGSNVMDTAGNVYVDLCAGFGALPLGHNHPTLRDAIETQLQKCVHGFGDVHPTDVKIELLESLAHCFRPIWPEPRAILGSNGSDAIDAALKTARLVTKRAEVIAFHGAYHGLMQGPLRLCGYSEKMRTPFQDQDSKVHFLVYPTNELELEQVRDSLVALLARNTIGAVVVEPVLGRGGVVAPHPQFLRLLRKQTREHHALLIIDEIWTGFYRTGPCFAFERAGIAPDLVCVGKALGGGMPMSACVGGLSIMRAWGTSDQESLHTGTFFGHPLACAASLAFLRWCESTDVEALVAQERQAWQAILQQQPLAVRQQGLAIGLDTGTAGGALTLVARLLERGFIALPAAADASVLQLSPSFLLHAAQRDAFVDALRGTLM